MEGCRKGEKRGVIHLPKTDKCAEDDGAPSYPQDTVDEEPTKHRQDNIGPGVERVE